MTGVPFFDAILALGFLVGFIYLVALSGFYGRYGVRQPNATGCAAVITAVVLAVLFFDQLRRHRPGVALAIVAIIVGAGLYFWYRKPKRH